MKPAELILPIPQGGSINESFRFYFNAAELSTYAEVWNKNNTQKLLDLTTQWSGETEVGSWTKSFPVNGSIRSITYTARCTLNISATPQQTSLVKEDGFWDLLFVYPDGSRFYQVRGPAPLRIRATRGPTLP